MQGSEYGRDSAVIVGRLAVANPHVLVVATHKLQKNASFKFHIFDNIYWTYLTYFTSLCSTCSVTSSWATKYNFIIFVLHLPKALFWRGFSTEICSQTTPGLTPAPEPRKHGYCSIPVSPAFQQKNDSNFHYFASGGVKRLLYCTYFNSSDLFTRCCAWSLALCAFSICVCTGSRWIWRKIATLSFQCLTFR